MTLGPPPFAAGVHIPWSWAPQSVHDWAHSVGGGAPRKVRDLTGGFSPGAIALVEFEGREVFFKAVGAQLNPDSPNFHCREARVSANLPRSPMLPQLLATYDDGQWVALAYESVRGRLPQVPWQEDELGRAVESLGRLHDLLTPSPLMDVAPSREHLGDLFCGWRHLAAMDDVPHELDDWSRSHLEQLANLESGWTEAAEGNTLIHGDVRSDNMVIAEQGVVFVDWPHASVGSPVLDLVEWAPSVVLEGGPDPEELLARHGPSRGAEREAVNALLAAFAGFLTEHALRAAPVGLPTLRPFQGAQAREARRWLAERTGWR